MREPSSAERVLARAVHPVAARWIPLHVYRHDWRRAADAAYSAAQDGTLSPLDEPLAVAAIRIQARQTGNLARAINVLTKLSGVTWDSKGRAGLPARPHLDVAIGLADLLHQAGAADSARTLLEAVLADIDYNARTLKRGDLWYQKARPLALALLGQESAAMAELERLDVGFQNESWYSLEIDPAYERLRSSSRFKVLIAKSRAHADEQRARLAALRAGESTPARMGDEGGVH